MSMPEMQVVEISRHESLNGYVYEYDESIETVKEIRRTHQQRINWWHTKVDAKVDAEAA